MAAAKNHPTTRRKCRICKKTKEFEKRNETCSLKCSQKLRQQRVGKQSAPDGHKEETRKCPGCGVVKKYKIRQECCSRECATAAQKKKQKPGDSGLTQTFKDNGNLWELDVRGTRIADFDEFIKDFGVDLNVWEVKEFRITLQEGFAMPRAEGSTDNWSRRSTNPIIVPLNHIRGTFRRKVEVLNCRAEIEDLIAWGKKQAPRYNVRLAKPRPVASGNLLEVDIPDIHLAGLVWGKETGFSDWDLNLAKQHVGCAVERLIEQASVHRFERVLYVVGNDFLQADNVENATTRGTRQDVDTRYPKAYREGLYLAIRTADRLASQIAPVDIMIVPGNHDWTTTMTMGVALDLHYAKAKHVNVIPAPPVRRVYQWGLSLLGYTHGDKEARSQGKLRGLGGTFAAQFPREHGHALFREIHVGHWHSVIYTEQNGWIIRGLSALCPPSAWASEAGFVGSQRRADSFYWNKEAGNFGTGAYVIRDDREEAA
jgi:hypothetical protein